MFVIFSALVNIRATLYPDAFPVYPKYVKSECIPGAQKLRLARALIVVCAYVCVCVCVCVCVTVCV
jgi:hypothetical protein